MLVLEGAQAGLNWYTILKWRADYRSAYHNFDICRVAEMGDHDLDQLCQNASIIRNRRKIYAVRQNAQAFYIWAFVNDTPIINKWRIREEVPANSPTSNLIATDLKKRGMVFVGPSIIYAFMQATGMVNDHIQSCWCYDRD